MSPNGVGIFAPWTFPNDPLGAFGTACGAACAIFAATQKKSFVPSPRAFTWLASLTAALLSVAYIAFVLRGGPRIIDATAYALEARIFSTGQITWSPPGPLGSFAGRFLVPASHEGSLAVIFPPGYPFVLATFTRFGAPMLLGPLMGAAIVHATYALAKELLATTALATDMHDVLARASALFAIASVCMRYHTADTMAHGLLALLVTMGVLAAMRAKTKRWAVLAGACAGYAITTRFTSGFAVVLVGGAIVLRSRDVPRFGRTISFAAGVVLGVAPLLAYQSSAFGSAFASGQAAYYAASDGPPGCFRYGFGDNVGCLFEHGDYVKRFGGSFGAIAALETTGRRFLFHVGDVLSWEPLFVLVLIGAWTNHETRVLGGLVLLHVIFQAPFYFPGTYPGGGARMYADVIPLEHVLMAVAIGRLASRDPATGNEARAIRGTWFVLAAALFSFGLHNVHDHLALRDREGGRPMFDAADIASVPNDALVLTNTDHGFDLGAGPGRTPVIARFRNDDHDRLLHEALGKPPLYVHRYDSATGVASVRQHSFAPFVRDTEAGAVETWTFSGENEWPALAQYGGAALPDWSGTPCPHPSAPRALALRITGAAKLRLAVPEDDDYSITLRLRSVTRESVAIVDRVHHVLPLSRCHAVTFVQSLFRSPHSAIDIDARGGEVVLEEIELSRRKPPE